MNWSDLGKKLAGLGLPALGASVGGPLGAMTGRVVAEAIGAPAHDPATIAAALEANPKLALQLREVEAAMEARQMQHVEAIDKIEAEDRAHARTIFGDGSFNKLLTVMLLVVFVGAHVAVAIHPPSPSVLSLVSGGMTTIQTLLIAAVSYYLGSSSGSKEKQDILKTVLPR